MTHGHMTRIQIFSIRVYIEKNESLEPRTLDIIRLFFLGSLAFSKCVCIEKIGILEILTLDIIWKRLSFLRSLAFKGTLHPLPEISI